MKIKIDLHTHSTASKDGGITDKRYKQILANKKMDLIAVTDHNRIDKAQELQKKLGNKIIIGEEISSLGGDIIGLYLNESILKGLDVVTTVKKIKKQEGLVYIPHPLEKRRSGLTLSDLEGIKKDIDIIEIFNARSFGLNETIIESFAKDNNIALAIGSDSHCSSELGLNYNLVNLSKKISQSNLADTLKVAKHKKTKTAYSHFFCPAINRLKHATS
jgi:hypothetical protein